MRLFSNIISGMFHPLLMVTYGVVLALTFTYLAIYPPAMKLSDRHERVVPYLIFITSIMVCAFYMYKMMLPFWFISLLLGACVALILALLINFFWKISAHAIGTGGLLGGIMGVARIHLINPYWAFIIVILIAGLVGTSRIFLKRHTPMQVYAGFCLGFICTFVASFLSYIYLFI